MRMLSHSSAAALQTEIRGRYGGAIEILGQRAERQAALLEAIETCRGVKRAIDILLDQYDGGAFRGDGAEALVDVADDDRRQAKRQLVAQKQPRIGQQGAADRHHLLL